MMDAERRQSRFAVAVFREVGGVVGTEREMQSRELSFDGTRGSIHAPRFRCCQRRDRFVDRFDGRSTAGASARECRGNDKKATRRGDVSRAADEGKTSKGVCVAGKGGVKGLGHFGGR